MKSYHEIVSGIKNRVGSFFSTIAGEEPIGKIPQEGSSTVADWVKALFDEAVENRNQNYLEFCNLHGRKYSEPSGYFQDLQKLEAGNHWEVIGSRKSDSNDEWMHELVDPEIGNQIRTKVLHLTANAHDVTVMPNIAGINEILDQERENTHWRLKITEATKRMKTFGVVYFKSLLDKSEDPRGLATEVLIDNGGLLRSPGSQSFARADGCWYAIHASMQILQEVVRRYPDLDAKKLAVIDAEKARQIKLSNDKYRTDFKHTKLIDVLELWLDDDVVERTPFDEEEFAIKKASLAEGVDVPIDSHNDNHPEHIKAYTAWLQELADVESTTLDDENLRTNLAELVALQIEEHIEEDQRRKNEENIPSGKRRKYPLGRKVVIVGGQLAEDGKNPYEFDWRECFHEAYNERVPTLPLGRSDVEILSKSNEVLDVMLSRIADATVYGIQKPYFNIADKDMLEAEGGLNNDPRKPGFYQTAVPSYRGSSAPVENIALYNKFKENIGQQLGINQITRGESPTSEASAKLAQFLQMQNEILVTGEPNQNLMILVKELMETRLLIMRQFQTEPRFYFIQGQLQAINVSNILRFRQTQDPETGEMRQEEIPLLEVYVKPGSNFPRQWEIDLQLAMELFARQILPLEAVFDMLAVRYPQFGRNGQYYKLQQATQIGLQVMAQQQAREQQETKDMKMVADKFKSMGMKAITNPEIGAGNGDGTTREREGASNTTNA